MNTLYWGIALLILNIVPAFFSGITGWTVLGVSCSLFLIITGANDAKKGK